jgi:hypothetical protein
MTNCPGLDFWAILGALIQLLITVPWAISWRSTISNIATILLTSGKIFLPPHCCRPLAEPDPVYPYFLFFTTPSAQEASDKYHKIIFANGAASTRAKKILLPRRSPEGRIRLKKTPGPGGPGGFQVFGSWSFGFLVFGFSSSIGVAIPSSISAVYRFGHCRAVRY